FYYFPAKTLPKRPPPFVDRITAWQGIVDPVATKPAKLDARDFVETGRFRFGQVTDEDRSTNFVRAPAQSLQHRNGVVLVFWFSENVIVNCHERVGSEHDILWARTRGRHCFAHRVERCQFAQR